MNEKNTYLKGREKSGGGDNAKDKITITTMRTNRTQNT